MMETLDFSAEEEGIIAGAMHWLYTGNEPPTHLYSTVIRLSNGKASRGYAFFLSMEILRRAGFSPTDATEILKTGLLEEMFNSPDRPAQSQKRSNDPWRH